MDCLVHEGIIGKEAYSAVREVLRKVIYVNEKKHRPKTEPCGRDLPSVGLKAQTYLI